MEADELKFFDDISSKWDAMEVNSVPSKVNALLDVVGLKRGDRVLDLGTGTGVLIPFIEERIDSEGIIRAVDISEGMLEQARRKFDGRWSNLTFERLDFEKDDVEGKYDVIFLYCVYPHLSNPFVTLRRLAENNLQPSGRIIIGFPTNEDYINNIHKERKVESSLLPSAGALAATLSSHGFRARELPSEGYLVELVLNSSNR